MLVFALPISAVTADQCFSFHIFYRILKLVGVLSPFPQSASVSHAKGDNSDSTICAERMNLYFFIVYVRGVTDFNDWVSDTYIYIHL